MHFTRINVTEAPILPTDQRKNLDEVDDSRWLVHVNKACFEGEWSVIPLRGLAKNRTCSPILQAFNLEGATTTDEFENYSVADSFPQIVRFLQSFPCAVLSARLMRLNPGSTIKPHCDSGLELSSDQARLHYCLQSDPDVEFVINGQSLKIVEGELWYINAAAEHAVYHRGHKPRIHLVFDCIANKWLKEQLGMEAIRDEI